jgi:hypothetical protein
MGRWSDFTYGKNGTHTVVDSSSTQALTFPFSSHNVGFRSLPPRIEPLVLFWLNKNPIGGFPKTHFSLYRQPSICILCNSRFTSYTKQPIFLTLVECLLFLINLWSSFHNSLPNRHMMSVMWKIYRLTVHHSSNVTFFPWLSPFFILW